MLGLFGGPLIAGTLYDLTHSYAVSFEVAALLAGVLACLVVYGLNGLLVGRLRLEPLIVTLAAWIWARGLSVSLTGAQAIHRSAFGLRIKQGAAKAVTRASVSAASSSRYL